MTAKDFIQLDQILWKEEEQEKEKVLETNWDESQKQFRFLFPGCDTLSERLNQKKILHLIKKRQQ